MFKSLKSYFVLFLLALIWGSSFILIKKGLLAYDYAQVAALRLSLAFISLLPFVFFAFKEVTYSQLPYLLVVGLFGNCIPAFLFSKSQILLDSSFVGVLNSLTPIFTLLIGFFFFRIKIFKRNILGIILGCLGVLFLFFSSNIYQAKLDYSILFVVISTLCYAISLNVIKFKLASLRSVYITSLAFLFIGPFSLYYLSTTDFLMIINSKEGLIAFKYIVILSIIGTSFAVTLFNYLVKESSVIFASSVTYLIPLIALFWGFFDNEIIRQEYIYGLVFILFGVYLTKNN